GGILLAPRRGSGHRTLLRGPYVDDASWGTRGQIAYAVNDPRVTPAHRIGVIPANGSGRGRQVLRDAASPDWSPSGRRLALSRSDGLWVSDARGRHARRVVAGQVGTPAWSPSGRWIAFSYGSDLAVVRTDGSRLRTVRHPIGGLPLTDPAWQPLPVRRR
ncbi:MAG: hypothetical protein QOJ57_1258, partial [Thermoleophilaceae bacterium]|nr:hypothetical protein [Thermoleophilaceae bacterium]